MRVLIDARISPERMGGVQQVIVGLAQGLAELDRAEDVTFLTTGEDAWLRAHVGPHRIAHARRAGRSVRSCGDAVRRRLLERVPSLRRAPVLGSPLPRASALVPLPRVDVVHLLTQQGFTTRMPSLYTPHDLLHLHHPEFFTPADLDRRERVYRALCARASLVTVMTPWGRNDLIEQYGLEPERVRVVPWGAPLPATDDAPTEGLRERYGLPRRFALYPAHTWPHKNHVRLVEALAILRDRHGLRVPLVCTGHQDAHAERIHDRVLRLGLGGQVQQLGRVPSADLLGLYRLARCLVFPSLFEGWGMPVFEAFASSVPVACSTATSLPDQTRGAAVLFDPFDVEEMALALASVWEDDALRARLVASGEDRARALTWRRTAVAYRALYREVGGSTMDTLDRAMVEASRDGEVENVDLRAP